MTPTPSPDPARYVSPVCRDGSHQACANFRGTCRCTCHAAAVEGTERPPGTAEALYTPDRGDEVQIGGSIGNIVCVNDSEGTCTIAWWMPTGGPGFGEERSRDVPLDGLHVRQRATTSRPAPSSSPVGGRGLDVTALPEWEALRTALEIIDGEPPWPPDVEVAARALLAAADRGEPTP